MSSVYGLPARQPMYERHHEPLLPRPAFFRRVGLHALAAFGVLLVSLAIGMLGYHHFEAMTWVDSYVNAAMILSGMGPFKELTTTSGKIFAGTYAIFSGVIFLSTVAVVMAPVVHRVFHYFHLDAIAKEPSKKAH